MANEHDDQFGIDDPAPQPDDAAELDAAAQPDDLAGPDQPSASGLTRAQLRQAAQEAVAAEAHGPIGVTPRVVERPVSLWDLPLPSRQRPTPPSEAATPVTEPEASDLELPALVVPPALHPGLDSAPAPAPDLDPVDQPPARPTPPRVPLWEQRVSVTRRIPGPPTAPGQEVPPEPVRRVVSSFRPSAFPSVTVMGARQPAPPAAAEAAYVASAAATGPLDDEPQAPAAGAATGSGVGAHAAPKGKAQPQWRSVSPQAGAPTNRRKRRLGAAIIGVIGELLITVGCLLGLYVAWELGWTTIEARAYVDQVIKTEIITQDDWIVPASAPGSAFLEKRTDEPAAACLPPETPGFGEPWGIMHVPQWGYNYQVPVVEGIDRVEILNKGFIGHYPDTQRPGEIGNFATSAHRTTYGAPYNKAADLQEGDLLIMETANCYFVYEVTGYEIVYPHDVRVIWPVPNEAEATPTKRIITLTTCHPMYSAKQRYIVWGEMSYWSLKEKGAGPLEDLTPPAQRAQYEQEG